MVVENEFQNLSLGQDSKEVSDYIWFQAPVVVKGLRKS